jgi:hypothetical protein
MLSSLQELVGSIRTSRDGAFTMDFRDRCSSVGALLNRVTALAESPLVSLYDVIRLGQIKVTRWRVTRL